LSDAAIHSGNFNKGNVYEAGRMVSMDQPEAALGMLNHLVSGGFSVVA
jgi:carboxypeptidase C (cathepsin A)